MRKKLNIRTVSEHERITKGIKTHAYVTKAEKDAQKSTSVWAWTQFYHKPYQCDWNEAHQKAVERKLRYKNDDTK